MAERGEIFQVVTQRVSSCRLLISEQDEKWIDVAGPGLVLYVSFVNGPPDEPNPAKLDETRFNKAIKSLMNAKLASASGWKLDHSDAQSILSLAQEANGATNVNVVVVPQATLTGRLVPGDKYLKYHRQVDKTRGYDLYSEFVRLLVKSFKEGENVETLHGSQVDAESVTVTWGSYGKRQGWEMTSTGPSTHYFEF
jgi:hypothetical protein